ncbi:EscR/YscR/HrcR family type III secretion system export apparatus protein [Halovulum dunhuangense]|uniref:EscR/YscR/HrcR family type III secretion system export apparatus protein n=1 Tax=Halovulum dunhuangense TaxID=1505036 RepID=A0A849KZ77_9RHOB|nr:EscR/YscR/HrcR family type III secretion system export apparatus protein [Halovulum dunhuangense]
MEPVFTEAWTTAVRPALDGTIDAETAFRQGIAPFRTFMEGRTDPETLRLLAQSSGRALPEAGVSPDLSLLVPGFLLSEIQRGFEVGFLVFLPFLVIDLVIAAILMSMGMMMVPPAVVSLPFKLAFFVLADGWSLLAGAMVRSYAP